MSIKAEDFLQYASDCILENSEISFRNSVSRGYYGMYHKVISILKNKPDFSGNHHSALIEYLSNHAQHKDEPYESIKLKALSYILKQERLNRNLADYEIDNNLTIDDVKISLISQAKFIEKIEEIIS